MGSHQQELWAWAVFDAGLFGFYTATYNSFLPLWFYDAAIEQGSTRADATALWAVGVSASMVGTAVLAPTLGWVADVCSIRKSLLLGASTAAVLLTALCVLLLPSGAPAGPGLGSVTAPLVVASGGYMLYNAATPLYNSFLPHLAEGYGQAQLSLLATQVGNAGAGMLLSVLVLWQPSPLASIVIAGAAFGVLSAPLFLLVREPHTANASAPVSMSSLRQVFALCQRHRDLAIFMVSGVVLSEAGSVVFHVNGVYARAAAGIPQEQVVGATVLNRFCAALLVLLWRWVHDRGTGPMTCYVVACLFTLVAGFACLLLTEAWQYWVLQVLLAAAGTGSFSFQRTVTSMLAPQGAAGRVFGCSTLMSRAGGGVGPLLYAAIASWTGSVRWGFSSAAALFGAGMLLLSFVDVERGAQLASAAAGDPQDFDCESLPLQKSTRRPESPGNSGT